MRINVTIIGPMNLIFKGEAESVILPGDRGVFEVLPFHKRMLTRLLKGVIDVDGRVFEILRGAAKIDQNNVTIIVE